MSLTGSSKLSLSGTLISALDGRNARDPVDVGSFDSPPGTTWSSGVGANMVDILWSDQRTISASANDDLDLAAGLTDAFGNSLTFVRVKFIYIKNVSADAATEIQIDQTVTNDWSTLFGGGAIIPLLTGAWLAHEAPDAAAWLVTASTADLLRITNNDASNSAIYDITIMGASA